MSTEIAAQAAQERRQHRHGKSSTASRCRSLGQAKANREFNAGVKVLTFTVLSVATPRARPIRLDGIDDCSTNISPSAMCAR
jgi:hypothetical protein